MPARVRSDRTSWSNCANSRARSRVDVTAVDGIPEADVHELRRAEVADCGKPGFKRGPRVGRRDNRRVHEAAPQLITGGSGRRRDVRVAVDQATVSVPRCPRQLPSAVDRGGSVKPRTPRTAGARHGVGVLAACLVLSGGCGAAVPEKDAAAPARKPDFVLTKDQTHTKFSRRIEPAVRVPSGSVIEAFTHEATGGQVTPTSTVDDYRQHRLGSDPYADRAGLRRRRRTGRCARRSPDRARARRLGMDGEPSGFRIPDR